MAIEREQVLAFRVASHGLDHRTNRLVEAAARCGIQETPLGTAALAFHARVDGLSPAKLEKALSKERSLLALWAVRGAPYLVPANGLAIFTTGALPLDSESFRHTLGGWAPALEKAGVDPFQLLDKLVDAAKKLLDGKTMDVNELRDRLYARVRSLHQIERPDAARDDMPEPLFRAIGTTGAACIVSGRGTDSLIARPDQWLKRVPKPMDPKAARAELARRFLHCYGPASAQHFAEWTQRSRADATSALGLIEDELAEVTVQGKRWLFLAKDVAALESPPEAKGVRLLPVQDPYLQQRDRGTLLPDQTARRRLWQAVRGPGALLLDGTIAGRWRGRVKGNRWEVEIEPFGRRPTREMDAIVHEAETMAPFKGCSLAGVEATP